MILTSLCTYHLVFLLYFFYVFLCHKIHVLLYQNLRVMPAGVFINTIYTIIFNIYILVLYMYPLTAVILVCSRACISILFIGNLIGGILDLLVFIRNELFDQGHFKSSTLLIFSLPIIKVYLIYPEQSTQYIPCLHKGT